jgi:hypothetical protein
MWAKHETFRVKPPTFGNEARAGNMEQRQGIEVGGADLEKGHDIKS